MGVSAIEYTVYKQEDILRDVKDGQRLIIFEAGARMAALVFDPCFSSGIDDCVVEHVDFYALSWGWEGYTKTGYRSIFSYRPKSDDPTTDDTVIAEFKAMLEIDLSEPVQAGLF